MDNIEENNLEVSESVKSSLDTMVYWSKFLAILGYIGVGLMVLLAIIMFVMPTSYYYYNTSFVCFFYLIIAVIYYYPASYLYKFATNTRHALNSDNQTGLNNGLSNLASNFKFVGVMAVVIMSIYALMFVFGLFGFLMF
jgi:uncharacterized membrane protein YqjE